MMRDKKSTLFLSIFILIICPVAKSQKAKVTDIEIEKNITFAKVVWADENGFCVIVDKEFNGTCTPHFVYYFDSKGKSLTEPVKVKNLYSSQSDYCVILGKSILFFDGGLNDMNAHVLSLTSVVNEKGRVNDTLAELFYIRHTPENKKLIDPAYSFRIFPGIKKQKALITYNNNYKDPFKEGFQFRIVNEKGNVTSIDTMNLPYLDRECNINDVVYDDENGKVYLLCDLFALLSAEKREFKNSFVASYDISSKNYSEVPLTEVSFLKNKIQHVVKNGKIYFSGLDIQKYNASEWMAAFAIINKDSMVYVDGGKFVVDSLQLERFFGGFREVNRDYILPVNMVVDSDDNIEVGWTKFFTISQMAEKQEGNSGAVIASAMMFGLIGAAVAAAATSGANFEKLNPALSLKFFPETNSLEQKSFSSILKTTEYSFYSYSLLSNGDESFWLMNTQLNGPKKASSIKFTQPSSDCQGCDSLESNLKRSGLNTILPQSHLVVGNKNYFLGKYEGKNDDSGKPTDDKYFLIEIE